MSHSTHGRVWEQINQLRLAFLQQDGLPFAQVLSAETVADALARFGLTLHEPIYNALVTTWVFLSQVLSSDPSCLAAVARLLTFRLSSGQAPCSTATGGYCIARRRLPEGFLAQLMRDTGRALQAQALPEWRWRNREVVIFDGSTVSMPDTPDNQAAYPQPRSQARGVGFPLARIAVLFSWSVGSVLDFAICPFQGKGHSELGLLRSMWHTLPPGIVLLADRFACSYFEIALLRERGIDVVCRLHHQRRVNWRRGADQQVVWRKPRRPFWLDQATYDRLPEQMTMRVVRCPVAKRGRRTQSIALAATLLDRQDVTRDDLAGLYRTRWHAELDLRSLKTVMQMDVLRGQTPDIVRKELWAHLLAYNLIRTVMSQSAAQAEIAPRTISFKGTLQVLTAYQSCCHAFSPAAWRTCATTLLREIARHRVGHRLDRYEPRARKRRPKPYPLLKVPRQTARKKLMYMS